ncbi:MAG: hypothetical protein LBU47_01250 [Christensenellaceae bacterium]|nr:hypothetical protein [Christensenellaceae bacterium]
MGTGVMTGGGVGAGCCQKSLTEGGVGAGVCVGVGSGVATAVGAGVEVGGGVLQKSVLASASRTGSPKPSSKAANKAIIAYLLKVLPFKCI